MPPTCYSCLGDNFWVLGLILVGSLLNKIFGCWAISKSTKGGSLLQPQPSDLFIFFIGNPQTPTTGLPRRFRQVQPPPLHTSTRPSSTLVALSTPSPPALERRGHYQLCHPSLRNIAATSSCWCRSQVVKASSPTLFFIARSGSVLSLAPPTPPRTTSSSLFRHKQGRMCGFDQKNKQKGLNLLTQLPR